MMVLTGHLFGWLAHFFYAQREYGEYGTCVGYNQEDGIEATLPPKNACPACKRSACVIFWHLINVQQKLYVLSLRWMLFTRMITLWELFRLGHPRSSAEEVRALTKKVKEKPEQVTILVEEMAYEQCNALSEHYGQGI